MMAPDRPALFVTGATGQLGCQVVATLLAGARQRNRGRCPQHRERARPNLQDRGVAVHEAEYASPSTLDAAFQGVECLLLIASSEIGRCVAQHRNVIDSAKRAGVALIASTSLLHADTSPLALAEEHRQTERPLEASGIPFVLLQRGWYTENYAAAIAPSLAHDALLGCAGDGRIASAARADCAAAAALTA